MSILITPIQILKNIFGRTNPENSIKTTINPESSKKYIYIIGDIHGCFEELLELEEKINAHSKENNVSSFIISCGDLIDRGPYSKEVLEHFIQGTKNNTHAAVVGNHEVMMLEAFECFSKSFPSELPFFLKTYKQSYEINKVYFGNVDWETFRNEMIDPWLHHGGKECLDSFSIKIIYKLDLEIDSEIINFLLKMPLFYEGDNFIVTHATGENIDLKRLLSISKKYPKLMEKPFIDASNLIKDNDFKDTIKSIDNLIWSKKLPEAKVHEKLHISGHTPFKIAKYTKMTNTLQIDTGCVFGNELTAYCPETNTFISVKAKRAYKEKKLK